MQSADLERIDVTSLTALAWATIGGGWLRTRVRRFQKRTLRRIIPVF